MSTKNTAFYQDNQAITFDFSGEEVSSDAGLLLLYKLARNTKLIKTFSRLIPDPRNRLKELTKSTYDEVKQEYAEQDKAHQLFVGPFDYQADSWDQPQQVYAKIESTGKGMSL